MARPLDSVTAEKLAKHRERLSADRDNLLASGFFKVQLPDTPAEKDRQAALLTRRTQRKADEDAARALAEKILDPKEDPELIRDEIDDLRRAIFVLDAEIDDLVASQSMAFPSASEVANVSGAAGLLEARIASSASVGAIVSAADAVMKAWPL